MILAIDIGNTNVSLGVIDNYKITFEASLASDITRTADQFASEIMTVSALKGFSLGAVDGAIISSVVPSLTEAVREAVLLLTGKRSIVLGPGVRSGLHIKIDNPAQLGADLVAGAVGAIDKYELPALIVDLGTATKISVIDSKGAYLGCTISPGVGISLSALSGSAALLPEVNLNTLDLPAFGTNTVASMQAGIVIGTASMLDGLCDRIECSLGEKIKTVVATGGYAGSIIPYCSREVVYDKYLIFHGLNCIYNKN